jgi:5-dehydro-2-deoxygluconokinase
LSKCDLIIGTAEEIHILGGSTDTIKALRAIREKSTALIILKLGPEGCAAFAGAIPKTVEQGGIVPGFPVEVFNVLGAGDAFMAGFPAWLASWRKRFAMLHVGKRVRRHRRVTTRLRPSHADMGGDGSIFLALDERPRRLREEKRLEHLHWVGCRRGDYPDLTVLAIDPPYAV